MQRERIEVTPRDVEVVKRTGAFRPNYDLNTPPEALRPRLLRELLTYAGESHLELTGYPITISEIPHRTESPIEQETWQELVRALEPLPVGTAFLLQSPKWSWWGYNKEVWYFGRKTDQDSAYMLDLRLPIPASSPAVSLNVYQRIHRELSSRELTTKEAGKATPADIVRNPVIMDTSEENQDRFLQLWQRVVYEEEEIVIPIEEVKKDIEEKSWEKFFAETEAKIPSGFLDEFMGYIYAHDDIGFIRQTIAYERMMNLQSQVGCGPSCQASLPSETKQPYLTEGSVSSKIIKLEASCSDCKKAKSRCECQKAA